MTDTPQDFQRYARGYGNLWRKAALPQESAAATRRIAEELTAPSAMEHYNVAASVSDVPALLIAALNYRESGGRFDTYLGNGDPLSRPTTHIPTNRGPFTSWEAGAEDALRNTQRPPDGKWSIEFALYFAELYNGRGYFKHGENSPYVWAETSLEQRGMFVEDGRYDPFASDKRPGVAALFKVFEQIHPQMMLPSITATTEHPTMAPLPAPASNPFPAIITGLELLQKFLPMVTTAVAPAPALAIQIGVPLIEDAISLVDAAHKDGLDKGDVADFLDKLVGHLTNISKSLRTP